MKVGMILDGDPGEDDEKEEEKNWDSLERVQCRK